MFLFWLLYVKSPYARKHGLLDNKANCKLKRLVYPGMLIRLSSQRNWMRKPIQPPYQVTTLQGEEPQCPGGQMLLRSALTVCCFQLSGCLLEGETRLGGVGGNLPLFANSDPHPSALPTARCVASSFSVLRLVSAALGFPVTAPTSLPDVYVQLGEV